MRWSRRSRRIAGACFGALAAPLAGLVAVSPGTPRPVLDERGRPVPGSVSEKVFVEINGARQGLFIKSTSARNPVLLYVHGGMPDYFLTQRHPTGLERQFTVVWWEQRGAGISFSPDAPRGSVTLEQLVADTLAVTQYLRARFAQDRIYLMGHSGGTFVGMQAAARAPELFHAYVGVAQMTYQADSEVLAWEYMRRAYAARGDARMVARLDAAPVTPTGAPPGYLALRDPAMHELGVGTMRSTRSLLWGLVVPSLLFPEYTLREKWNLWRAKSRSGISAVWDRMVATDLRREVPTLAVPVYFFHGVHDYTVNYALARSYLRALRAPVKGFYSFAASAHSPMFEEPARMSRILREDVLRGTTRLADAATP